MKHLARVSGLRAGAESLGLRVWGSGFRVWLGFCVGAESLGDTFRFREASVEGLLEGAGDLVSWL